MKKHSGFSMIEVLVTIVILAIGLLGLAGLQLKTQNVEMESYQRTQALVILNDMVNRLAANPDKATYVGNLVPSKQDCNSLPAPTVAQLDLCEWGNALVGAAEASESGESVGAMIGARGCIRQLVAPDVATGTSGEWEVAVAWQGMFDTVAPNNPCGSGAYGSENMRRVIATRVGDGTLRSF